MNDFPLKKFEKDTCRHNFDALGFSVFKVTDTTVEAVAAVFCTKCSLFRTKILTFRRELNTEEKKE
jgi:hypothetical protein